MPAILELPEMRERIARWTVDDYERLIESGLAPKRGELICGIIIDKTSKSPLHCDLAKSLYDRFQDLQIAGFAVFQERALRLADSEPEPDVSFVRGQTKDFRRKHPSTAELVVEVAVSSVAADREYALLYAEAKVAEYWIVLAESEQIEVRWQPEEGVYRQQRTYCRGETLACQSVPELSVVLDELFG